MSHYHLQYVVLYNIISGTRTAQRAGTLLFTRTCACARVLRPNSAHTRACMCVINASRHAGHTPIGGAHRALIASVIN